MTNCSCILCKKMPVSSMQPVFDQMEHGRTPSPHFLQQLEENKSCNISSISLTYKSIYAILPCLVKRPGFDADYVGMSGE